MKSHLTQSTASKKRFGYTHAVSFLFWHDPLQMWVNGGYPTTADAVDMHFALLRRNKDVVNIKVHVL